MISSRIWLWTYQLEEARERYAAHRYLLRQALVCVALAILRWGER